MSRLLLVLFAIATILPLKPLAAAEPGWRQIAIPVPGSPPIAVALYYPTQATPRPIPMGPFTPTIAIQAPPDATVKGLIILSHGTGGSELAHSSLAEALARHGYLVAALRHPGDNWQDRSLLQQHPDRFFAERPQQASRVIDALLADPLWKDRIASDAHGPRIGAIGHSAGGYTVLALAGAEPDPQRMARHCAAERADDPIFCGMVHPPPSLTAAGAPTESIADPRVRAVVALAPLGVIFTAPSLARVAIPVAIYTAELDRFLVPRFHAEWIAANIPTAAHHRIANAWHFAFVDPPRSAIPSEDGDLRADPPGFDRPAFLQQLARDLPAFFDNAFQ